MPDTTTPTKLYEASETLRRKRLTWLLVITIVVGGLFFAGIVSWFVIVTWVAAFIINYIAFNKPYPIVAVHKDHFVYKVAPLREGKVIYNRDIESVATKPLRAILRLKDNPKPLTLQLAGLDKPDQEEVVKYLESLSRKNA